MTIESNHFFRSHEMPFVNLFPESAKCPMYFIGIACAANILLDYLFIGFFHMGPAGAALGTTLAQTLSVLIAFIMYKSNIRLSIGTKISTETKMYSCKYRIPNITSNILRSK